LWIVFRHRLERTQQFLRHAAGAAAFEVDVDPLGFGARQDAPVARLAEQVAARDLAQRQVGGPSEDLDLVAGNAGRRYSMKCERTTQAAPISR
jgi:hypothetical protein